MICQPAAVLQRNDNERLEVWSELRVELGQEAGGRRQEAGGRRVEGGGWIT